ncbi:uncharacterized protein LOC134783064 [Penaeus indicus]|uniref:uncharacterized protein LOC134783060 n=1 Tax=Penaeus indicus TaxID=29960 RepID=UPI00300D4BEE
MDSNPEASYGHGQLQSASYGEFCNPVTDQEPEMRCLAPTTLEPASPQQKSHPQRPLQCMPLQEPAHGSDQQHLTNYQAPLAVLQSNLGRNGARTELVESATDFTANPSNQYDMELYNIMYPKFNGSFDEFLIQQPATQPKGLIDNITYVSALPDFQQTKDNDVEQPSIILVEYEVYDLVQVCSESGPHLTNWDADKEQQTFQHTYKLPDGEMVLIGMDEKDSLVQISTVSDLWVKLATPGENLKQFLRKNWSNMLHYLPVIYQSKQCRWQEEEPDPKDLKLWFKAITEKYWTVMLGKTDKIPTNEEEGIMWQKKFMERCETVRPRARGRPY